MPIVFAIPVLLNVARLSFRVLSSALTVYAVKDDFAMDDDEIFYSNVESYETEKKEKIELEANTAITEVDTFVENSAPSVEDTINVTVVNPTTMPMYLAQQNELLQVQNEKSNNLISQTKFQNDLLARSIQTQIVSNANTKMIAETLASSLPALVMQMQQVSKIPIILKTNSDINVAYNELALENSNAMLIAIHDLVRSADVNSLGSLSSANSMESIASNAIAQQRVAEYEDEYVQIKDSDGNVVEEFKRRDLAALKDYNLLKAKGKEFEVRDYETTEQAIKNLDGNTVATMKPMEAHAVKSITDAKNATDEMEFELDDSILDNVFAPLVLPTFTARDSIKENNFIFKGVPYDG